MGRTVEVMAVAVVDCHGKWAIGGAHDDNGDPVNHWALWELVETHHRQYRVTLTLELPTTEEIEAARITALGLAQPR